MRHRLHLQSPAADMSQERPRMEWETRQTLAAVDPWPLRLCGLAGFCNQSLFHFPFSFYLVGSKAVPAS
jgi:hypothetical protein